MTGLENKTLNLYPTQHNGVWATATGIPFDIGSACVLSMCPDFDVYLKSNSPDYRDWELVYSAEFGWLFSEEEIFKMSLDVSVESK